MVPFQVYINSYIALLNARYYLQPNTDVTASPKPHIEFNIHNLELPIRALQDNKLQTSGRSSFEEKVADPTRPGQAFMVSSCITFTRRHTYVGDTPQPRQSLATTMEMNSFLSV